MPWDIWMLVAILALCVTVIGWSCWGFRCENRSEVTRSAGSHPVLLAMTTGSYLYIPSASGYSARAHRACHYQVSPLIARESGVVVTDSNGDPHSLIAARTVAAAAGIAADLLTLVEEGVGG